MQHFWCITQESGQQNQHQCNMCDGLSPTKMQCSRKLLHEYTLMLQTKVGCNIRQSKATSLGNELWIPWKDNTLLLLIVYSYCVCAFSCFVFLLSERKTEAPTVLDTFCCMCQNKMALFRQYELVCGIYCSAPGSKMSFLLPEVCSLFANLSIF